MIIEYKGVAERQVGPGIVHEVRAWWDVTTDSEREVKRAAQRAVRQEIRSTDHVSVDPIHADTYSTPRLNALVRVRVISHEQHVERKRLAALVVLACATCGACGPCNYLRMPDGREQGACFTCLRGPLDKVEYRTIAWIKADGRLQR